MVQIKCVEDDCQQVNFGFTQLDPSGHLVMLEKGWVWFPDVRNIDQYLCPWCRTRRTPRPCKEADNA